VLKESGHLVEAENAYRTALTYDPRSADSHVQLGHVLQIQGKKEEARAEYLRAIVTDPSLKGASLELVQFGWSEAHFSELQGMLDTATNLPGALSNANDPPGKSFVHSSSARRTGPKKPRPFYARRNLPMSRFSHMRGGPSRITLADRARDAGQWERAAGYYRAALQRNPKNPPIWVQYGHVLKESGHLVEAENAYRTALTYDPRSADSHVQLGHVLKIQGKKEEARAEYLRAIAIDPSLEGAALEFAKLIFSADTANALRTKIPSDAGHFPKIHLFDPEWYGRKYNVGPMPALDHFAKIGSARRYDPHPLFNTAHYNAQSPVLQYSTLEAVDHYMRIGGFSGRSPHPLFDDVWYFEQYHDARELGICPLIHYLWIGASKGYKPNPLFDTSFYWNKYEDVRESDINPLVHYLRWGAVEGRQISQIQEITLSKVDFSGQADLGRCHAKVEGATVFGSRCPLIVRSR
jgi:tetratricopeptide (TPR) repeat protein